MGAFYLPIIEPNDYESFRRTAHFYMPNTYNEWLKFRAKERESLALRGHDVREVTINSSNFAEEIRAGRHANSMQGLCGFAEKLFDGNV